MEDQGSMPGGGGRSDGVFLVGSMVAQPVVRSFFRFSGSLPYAQWHSFRGCCRVITVLGVSRLKPALQRVTRNAVGVHASACRLKRATFGLPPPHAVVAPI